MGLGDKIKKCRENKGLSVSELSRQTAIPESIIIKIETDVNYSNTPHGRLQAKKVLKYLGVENIQFDEESEKTVISTIQTPVKNHKLTKYIAHIGMLLTLVVFFIYANAVYKQEDVKVQYVPNYGHMLTDVQNQENTTRINSITLKSSGDVWITATVDGEKTIFNVREGETKTISFQNKIAFETIGNVNQLTIQFGDHEVSFKDKEVVHNVFVDEEGIFYNGYNVIRGKPKI